MGNRKLVDRSSIKVPLTVSIRTDRMAQIKADAEARDIRVSELIGRLIDRHYAQARQQG